MDNNTVLTYMPYTSDLCTLLLASTLPPHTLTSTPPHTLTSTLPHTLTSTLPHTLTSTLPHTLTSTLPHTLTSTPTPHSHQHPIPHSHQHPIPHSHQHPVPHSHQHPTPHPHLLEEFREIVHISCVTQLGLVPPLVKLVLGDVRSTHLHTMEGTVTRTKRLKYILCMKRMGGASKYDGLNWASEQI